MSKMIYTHNCKNCGAPILSEVCEYCGTRTELKTEEVTSEYATTECRNGDLTIFGTWIYAIMVIAIIGLTIMTINAFKESKLELYVIIAFFILFWYACILCMIKFEKSVYSFFVVKLFGKEVSGTVYGYLDDKIIINSTPTRRVKILINSGIGKKFIIVPIYDVSKMYPVNSKVKVKIYKIMQVYYERSNYAKEIFSRNF